MQSSAENDEQVMSLVEEALGLPENKRKDFLRAACGNHTDVYSQAAEVLEWEERMGGFLQQPLIQSIDLEETEPGHSVFQSRDVICDGRFEVLREVGEGGMAVVYEVIDRKRNQRIAIKCPKPGFGRLLSPELEGALKVRHPNICLVNDTHTAKTDSGEVDFLTMEFLDGETLSARLARDGKLTPEEALTIARQLCAGLAAAHQAGIAHRDLKPANIILTKKEDGEVRAVITDFGLAAESRLQSPIEGGTPRYMAPELWQGEKPDKASDVYALGVILYEMITGTKSFQPSQLWDGKPTRAPEPPSVANKDLPALWDKAILPCIDRLPEERPNASDVLQVFDRPPLWKSPILAAAVLALVALAAGFQKPLLRLIRPADVRLAILPVQADNGTDLIGAGTLQELSERLRQSRSASPSLSIIAPETALHNHVTKPEQAQTLLQATHTLRVQAHREGNEIVANAVIVELAHGAELSNFEGRYSASTIADMPRALAGSISAALHLPPAAGPDSIAPQASEAYTRGLQLLHEEGGNFRDSIPLFQEAAGLDPHSALPIAALAEAKLTEFQADQEEDELREARQIWHSAEALNPDSVRVHFVSGLLNQAEGNAGRALEDYRRILEIEPNDVDALLQMASIFDSMHQPDKAIQCYRQAEKADPRNPDSYAWFGSFYFHRGLLAEAEQQFLEETRYAPTRLSGYVNLAGTLVGEGKNEQALKVLEPALKVQETPDALNTAGAALVYLGRDSEAAAFYERSLRLDPGSYRHWLNLGDSQRRTGMASHARMAYKNGERLALAELQTKPDVGETRAYVAYFEARLGDSARARQEIRQALHSSPANSQVIRMAVLTYVALGERDSALRVLETATLAGAMELARHPDMAELRRDPRFIEVMTKKQKEQQKGG